MIVCLNRHFRASKRIFTHIWIIRCNWPMLMWPIAFCLRKLTSMPICWNSYKITPMTSMTMKFPWERVANLNQVRHLFFCFAQQQRKIVKVCFLLICFFFGRFRCCSIHRISNRRSNGRIVWQVEKFYDDTQSGIENAADDIRWRYIPDYTAFVWRWRNAI